MRTRTKFIGITTAACLGVAMGTGPAMAAQPAAVGTSTAPASSHQVTQQAIDVTGTTAAGEAFTGNISNLTTTVQDGTLVLSGTITDTTTGLTQDFTTTIEDIVPQEGTDGGGAGEGGCEILALDLGPLDLDLLGLVVQLEPVVLDVTAVPGAGNLLGNLLCAVTGLLDGGPLNGVNALLNRLLTGLGL